MSKQRHVRIERKRLEHLLIIIYSVINVGCIDITGKRLMSTKNNCFGAHNISSERPWMEYLRSGGEVV